ncbi:hypothetical protein AB6A40_000831 [Gnathostoma spinigerum]|uniref:Uncharacterized protein n=1 Tax=Gnathostoma spinigerum TaxID=75299 RepID=A0ABD6EC99_9BILA
MTVITLTDSSNIQSFLKLLIVHITILSNILHCSFGCPHFTISACKCEDLHQGIRLNCSNSDAYHVMQTVRANQAALGLIHHFELRSANLRHIPAAFFAGLYIKKLDLAHNQLTEIDANAFLGMPFDVLNELLLNNNNLSTLPSTALVPLTALLKIDLSNNSITDLTIQNTLPSLPKLYDINLADNKICTVHRSVFDNVKNVIQTINLGRNCLNNVPASAIRGFKQLMSLHLHGNNISSLDPLAFMNLPQLNLLNLASNNIKSIHRQAFLNVPALRYFYLSNNGITEVYAHEFGSFGQLEMLDLTANLLIRIPTGAFADLPNLRQLYLGENRITTLEVGSFSNSSIIMLVLSSNRLRELNEGVFEGMNNLQQLSLKDNEIKSIDQNVFFSNPNLAMIDLSHNELIDLPSSLLITQLNVLLVDLSFNKMIRTPYGAFSRRVKTVLLNENPLVCTEKVHMLQEGVGVYIPDNNDVVCSEIHRISQNSMENTEFLQSSQESELRTNATSTSYFRRLDSLNRLKITPKRIEFSSTNNPLTMPTIIRSQLRPVDESINVDSKNDNSRLRQIPILMLNQSGSNPNASDAEIDLFQTDFDDHLSPYNPNAIHPLPVPFLSRPPKIYPAFVASSSRQPQVTKQTLPPSIVLAPIDEFGSSHSVSESDNTHQKEMVEEFQLNRNPDSKPNKMQDIGEQFLRSGSTEERRIAAPTLIITICLSTVGMVMFSVLVGLCIAKHRHMRRLGTSSIGSATAARTDAYVSAQAAQLNMVYDTTHRKRGTLTHLDDGHSWMYSPSSYAGSYYR